MPFLVKGWCACAQEILQVRVRVQVLVWASGALPSSVAVPRAAVKVLVGARPGRGCGITVMGFRELGPDSRLLALDHLLIIISQSATFVVGFGIG